MLTVALHVNMHQVWLVRCRTVTHCVRKENQVASQATLSMLLPSALNYTGRKEVHCIHASNLCYIELREFRITCSISTKRHVDNFMGSRNHYFMARMYVAVTVETGVPLLRFGRQDGPHDISKVSGLLGNKKASKWGCFHLVLTYH